MSYIPFDTLPDSSRLWIFASDRKLSVAETDMLLREMQSFCNSWLAHQQPVTGSCKMMYDQFLFIAADEAASPSGCSTDEMMRRVRMLGETHGVEFFGMPRVQYRDNGTIKTTSRIEFDSLAKNRPPHCAISNLLPRCYRGAYLGQEPLPNERRHPTVLV